jgi:hypothetical protein
MENNKTDKLNGLVTTDEVFAEKYNKMKALLIEARYLLTAPHRTEEVDLWIDEFKEVIK